MALVVAFVAALAVAWSFGGDIDYLTQHGEDMARLAEVGAWTL